MIFMTMGDHKSFYFGYIILQISHIRNDQIDSEHVILRECKPAVYHNDTVFIFESSNIHTDLL